MRIALLLALVCLLAGCTTGRRENAGSVPAAKTLRVALSGELPTLDPARTQDLEGNEALSNLFEGLIAIDEKNRPVPALAEKWDVSPDGKTYIFHLRTDVTFHNGRPFVAADVKYSWERALAPATRSQIAANYLEGVLGVQDVTGGKRKDLPGVEVVDSHTLKVTLDRPRAYFLGMLAYPTNYIVCREAVEKTGGNVDEHSLIGTGPFLFESYQAGTSLTLKANPHYWGGKPPMDRIEMPVLISPETTYNNFVTGQLDIAGAELSRYVQNKAANKLTDEYKVLPYAAIDYVGMQPVKQPIFANKTVRQAFARAIDRAQILKVAYKNVGRVADGFLPPELPDAGPMPPPIPYVPAQARQLLAQAGYPGGKGFPTLTLTIVQQQPAISAIAQIIRANLRDNLGIVVNIQERERGEYFAEESKGQMEFYLADWIADYPDPQNFLSTLFVSTAPLNRVHYRNPAFDRLCREADAEADESKRAALYSRANRLLMDDVGVLPLTFGPRILLIQKNVRGWRVNLCKTLPFTQTTKTAP